MTDATMDDILEMTGCRDRQDLEDMALVGKSLMDTIASVTAQPGPFHGWAPADDPAEIVVDLINALDDATVSSRVAAIIEPRCAELLLAIKGLVAAMTDSEVVRLGDQVDRVSAALESLSGEAITSLAATVGAAHA